MKTILSRMALMAVMLFVSLSAAAEQITQEQLNKLVGTYRLEIPGLGDTRASVAANGDFSLIAGGEDKGFNLLKDDEAVITDNMITFGDDYKFLLQDGVATHVLFMGDAYMIPREGSFFEDGLEILPLIAGRYAGDEGTCVIDESGAGTLSADGIEPRFSIHDALTWAKAGDDLYVFVDFSGVGAFTLHFSMHDDEVTGVDLMGTVLPLVEKIEVEAVNNDTMYLVVTNGDKVVFRTKADDKVKVEWKTGAELRK